MLLRCPGKVHHVSFEGDGAGIVYEPVHDCISDCCLAEPFMPILDGELTGDDRGFPAMPVFEYLKQIPGLFSAQRTQTQVIEDQEFDLRHRDVAGRFSCSIRSRSAPLPDMTR